MADQPLDLSRLVLHATLAGVRRDDAREAPTQRMPTCSAAPSGDPVGLQQALADLVIQRCWSALPTLATLVDAWPRLFPDLAQHAVPTRYDDASGALEVETTSSAYATQLRLVETAVLARVNAHIGSDRVRALQVRLVAPAQQASPSGMRARSEAPRSAAAETAFDAAAATRDNEPRPAVDNVPESGNRRQTAGEQSSYSRARERARRERRQRADAPDRP